VDEDLRIVFESRNRAACRDRSLVLAAAGIPHKVLHDPGGSLIVVPAEHSAHAIEEISIYDEANPPVIRKPKKTVRYQNAVPGIVAYVLIVCGVAWLAGESAFGENWLWPGLPSSLPAPSETSSIRCCSHPTIVPSARPPQYSRPLASLRVTSGAHG
jgi:hypothetical protein